LLNKLKKLIIKTSNLIKKRIIKSELKKLAEFIEDLKKETMLQQYFVTKEDYEKEKQDVLDKGKPFYEEQLPNWYEITSIVETLYMYQLPPNGINNVLLARCYVVELRNKGINEPVCIAGLYEIDKNDNITNNLIGTKIFKNMDLVNTVNEIIKTGMVGKGRIYITNKEIYKNFKVFREYIKEQIDNRNKNIIIKNPKTIYKTIKMWYN